MAVITISRELGSEGDAVAEGLCQTLGYDRVDKAILMAVAEEAGVDVEAVLAKERSFAQKPKLFSSELTALHRRDPGAFGRRSDVDDQTYAQVTHKALLAYAEQGDVIVVGRGGQMVLRDWPDALHVHVYAPLEIRAERVRRRFNITEQEARRRIEQSDEQKRQFIRHMHGHANWKDLKHYHLTINTGYIASDLAIELIALAVRAREKPEAVA
jgi:cytidylate kinase